MWAGRDATAGAATEPRSIAYATLIFLRAAVGRLVKPVSLDIFEEFMPDRNVLLDPWNSLNAKFVLLQ